MKRINEIETPLQNKSLKIISGQFRKPPEAEGSKENYPENNKNFIVNSNEIDFIGSTYSGLSVFNNLIILEQRVRERTSELESFTHAVSHDLRAPIRCINRFSQALIKDYGNFLDDTGKKYLNTILSKAQQMGSLVDILLSFFMTGHKELIKKGLNIEEIVDEVIDEQKICSQDELDFIQTKELLPAFGDRDLIKIAFSNLISNAVKFSNKEPNPEIIIGSYKTENDTVYYVKDNGEGFNMEHADKLFSAFQRLHKSDEFEGTGIGLSIVERVINRHGGKVWAESKIKEGAVFYFSLPLD